VWVHLEQRFRFNRKYRILKEDDLGYLSKEQREAFEDICHCISYCRHLNGKKDNTYLVVNTDESYAKQVAEIMVRHGHCAKDGDGDVIEID
jgi:hypothetical protein